ncbi:MAG: hypothetical protein ACLP7P_04445 [Rhodomicrobium sp.]
MQPRTSIPLNWPSALWMAFIAAASVALSFGFACATPLAAFGAMSALTLDRRNAVLLTGAVWLANQAVGCSILNYPLTANSLGWGAVLGLAAIFAALAARWSALRFAGISPLAMPAAAFVAAFAVYEITLFAAALLLGGTEDFTAAIIGRVFEINAISMLGMLLLNRAGALAVNSKEFERSRRAALALAPRKA